jgi:O-acetyl-ADP-ribose deacetylase
MSMKIKVVRDDITRLDVDAIVNAAKGSLAGGGGVDGAIHRVAGKDLFKECMTFPEVEPGIRCKVGEAKVTLGYRLPALYVIHTVGPNFNDVHDKDPELLLMQAYKSCLAVAENFKIRSVAFPAISCGVYGCSIESGALCAVKAFMSQEWDLDEVIFVLFSKDDFETAKTVFNLYQLGRNGSL